MWRTAAQKINESSSFYMVANALLPVKLPGAPTEETGAAGCIDILASLMYNG